MSTFSDRVHIASAVSITNTVHCELAQTESEARPAGCSPSGDLIRADRWACRVTKSAGPECLNGDMVAMAPIHRILIFIR